MAKRNTYQSYGSISKFFHWTIALLIIGMIIYGYSLSFLPESWAPTAYNIHKLFGLLILTLMLLRLIWALMNPKPKLPSKTPLWEIALERLMHFSLYLVLLAMPISGWLLASAAGKPPRLFGLSLGLPIAKNDWLRDNADTVHITLAIVIIVMVTLHVLAALKHHFIDKDNVLKRMMPGK